MDKSLTLADRVTCLAETQNKNNEVEPRFFVYLISGGFSIQCFCAITAMWTEQEEGSVRVSKFKA